MITTFNLGLAGDQSAQFNKIQDIVDFAEQNKLTTIKITINPGSYSDSIKLPCNIGFIFEGAVSGAAILGDISWTVSGGIFPLIPQSYLVLRNVAVNSITITDAEDPATKALLILENCAIFNNIISRGISVLDLMVSGISTASTFIAGLNVSSVIIGELDLPNSRIGLTNTQVSGLINCKELWAEGSEIDGYCTATNCCEFRNSILWSNIISPMISIDNITYNQAIVNELNLNKNIKFLDVSPSILLDVKNGDIKMSLYQSLTATIIFVGEINEDSSINIIFPNKHFYNLDTTQLIFNERSKLNLIHDNYFFTITKNSLYKLSINNMGVFVV